MPSVAKIGTQTTAAYWLHWHHFARHEYSLEQEVEQKGVAPQQHCARLRSLITYDVYHAVMIKVRRAIAICILALFTCQTSMAGIDEHVDHSSDVKVVNGLHLDDADHASANSPHPDQPATPDLIEGDCCHAHGHCHLLAFTGQITNVSIPPSHGLAVSCGDAYCSLFLNTLLRPPTHA